MAAAVACSMSAYAAAPAHGAAPADVSATSDRPGGVAELGQIVHFTIDGSKHRADDLHFRLRLNNARVLQQGHVPAGAGTFDLSQKLDEPGWLYLEVLEKTPTGEAMAASAGAIVAPTKIEPAEARPDDFDPFWKAQVAELASVPPNAQVKAVESDRKNVQLFDVTLDNVGGAHVHAQLARPATGETFPALVIYQWAGVYPLQKGFATSYAAEGWLVLNVFAHDLPIYEPKSFYDEQSKGALRGYAAIGGTSRDTSYFRKMLLGDYQAIEYLTHRPDWNGHVLVVRGESQGGLQTFAMADLHPKVTAMTVTVPAGADTLGEHVGRSPGWPYWQRMQPADQRAAILQTSRYYDPENFAASVNVPSLVCVGLCDTTAPAPGVIAAFHRLSGPKELILMPDATHTANHQLAIRRSTQWLASLLKTGQPPMAAAESGPGAAPLNTGASKP